MPTEYEGNFWWTRVRDKERKRQQAGTTKSHLTEPIFQLSTLPQFEYQGSEDKGRREKRAARVEQARGT